MEGKSRISFFLEQEKPRPGTKAGLELIITAIIYSVMDLKTKFSLLFFIIIKVVQSHITFMLCRNPCQKIEICCWSHSLSRDILLTVWWIPPVLISIFIILIVFYKIILILCFFSPHLTEYLEHLSILIHVGPFYFFKWLLSPQVPHCIENGPFSPSVGIWVVSNFLLLYQHCNGYS